MSRLPALGGQSTGASLWATARQASLSMGFPRQEYWSGLPFPSPGDVPDPGIEPGFPALQEILYCLSHQGRPNTHIQILKVLRKIKI